MALTDTPLIELISESVVVFLVEENPLAIHLVNASTFDHTGDLKVVHQLELAMTVRPTLPSSYLPIPRRSALNAQEICSLFRKLTHSPIIFLSEANDDEGKLRALQMGADDYITKPLDQRELADRLAAVLLRRRIRKDSPDPILRKMEFGRLVVDTRQAKVIHNGMEVYMQPREYALLSYMVENPNRVLAPQELLNEVWGPGYETAYNALKMSIRRLRKKIEADPSQPCHILSRRGFGYLFAP